MSLDVTCLLLGVVFSIFDHFNHQTLMVVQADAYANV